MEIRGPRPQLCLPLIFPEMSNEDDSPCLAHLGDSVSGFTTKLFYLPWRGRHHTAAFLPTDGLSNHHLCTLQGQETIFFAPSQVLGCYWHSHLGLEQGVVPGDPEGRAGTAWVCCSSWHRFCSHPHQLCHLFPASCSPGLPEGGR